MYSDGEPGEIAAFGIASRGGLDNGGYRWDGVAFDDPALRRSGKTAYVGIPFGVTAYSLDAELNPRLSISNFGSSATTVVIQPYMSNAAMNTTVKLPAQTVVLNPDEARDLPIHLHTSDELESPSAADGMNVLSVIVTGGKPGQLAEKLYSLGHDETGEEVEMLGHDVMAYQNGGGHPFSLTNDKDSSVFLMNTSENHQVFNLRISNQSGAWQKAITLAAHQTKVFSIEAMIATREKDDSGRSLPATMTQGEVSWFTPGLGQGAGRLMVSDAATGMARNFSCSNTLVVCGVDPFNLIEFGLSTISADINGQAEVCMVEYYPDCTGGVDWGPGSGFSWTWTSNNTSIAPINSDPTQDWIDLWGAGIGNAGFDASVSDGLGCYAYNSGSDTVASVAQSPTSLNMSNGDTNKGITVTISPAGAIADVNFNIALTSNPNSASQASVAIGPTSGVTGSQSIPISVSGSNSPSGIFTATAQVYGSQAPQSTKLTIPPQVLIQVLYGEAHGQTAIGDNVSEPAVGASIRNRFGHPEFPGGNTSNWQDVIVSSQYAGINTGITTGTTPELNLASALFAGTQADTVAGSTCFFSPTAADWTAVQQALNSGTTAVPVMDRDPKCYANLTPGEQIVYKSSIGNNASGSGAPAFLFERQKSQDTDPAVVEIP